MFKKSVLIYKKHKQKIYTVFTHLSFIINGCVSLDYIL